MANDIHGPQAPMTWAEANPEIADRARAAADYLNTALKLMEQLLDESEGFVIFEGLIEAETYLSRAIYNYAYEGE